MEPDLPPITPDHIAAIETVAGRPTTMDAHRDLMRPSLEKMRERLRVLRDSPLAVGQSPATVFHPLLPPVDAAKQGGVATVATDDTWDGNVESLAFAPVTLLSELLEKRRVTSRQLVELALSRLKRFGPELFCVVAMVPEDATLAAADAADREIAAGKRRGPLHGIPFGTKDSCAVAGMPTTDGVAPYRDRIADTDAEVVRRLGAAGAVLVAKLSLGELAMDDTWFGGKTRNPWNTEEGSSGSSAGSASAVAAGLVPFAIGTETWGSIISPCNRCGTTGLRPTFGRVPRTGVSALTWSMDKIGPIARTVADAALVFAAMQGPEAGDPSTYYTAPFAVDFAASPADLRIGYDIAAWEYVADKMPALLPFYDAAKATVEQLTGATLVPVHLPASVPAYEALPMTIIVIEGAAAYSSLLASGQIEELVQQDEDNWPNAFRVAQTVPATEYVQAQRVRAHLQQQMRAALADVDAYLTVPCIGASLAYTNLTGHPEAITRCGFTDTGTPVMLSVVGDLLREDAVLRVAYAYEQATGWHTRAPASYS